MAPPLQQAHLQRIYRPIVVVFFLLAAMLLAGVVYAGSSGAVLTMTAVPQALRTTIIVTIGPKNDGGPLYLTGQVTKTTLSETVTVQPTESTTLVPANARGRVTFHNETGKAQPLAAGTRLRASSGVIARTTKRIDVPAGGTVDTEAVADPLGESGNVPAGRFIIVALWPGLQDKIYAQSDQAFTGGLVQQSGGLSLDDLTNASRQAEEAIGQKFGSSQAGNFRQLIPQEVATVPPADQPSDRYEVTVTMTGLSATYQTDRLLAMIRQHLEPLVPAGQALRQIAAPTLVFEQQPTEDEVVVTVKAEGDSVLAADSDLLQASQFAGLDRAAILAKLSGTNVVKDVRLRLTPPWRKTAPPAERIRVIVK